MHIYFFKNLWASPFVHHLPCSHCFYISSSFVMSQRSRSLTYACTFSHKHKKATKLLRIFFPLWHTSAMSVVDHTRIQNRGVSTSFLFLPAQCKKHLSCTGDTVSNPTQPGCDEIRWWLQRCN